jgi:spermidine/putrescine transport system permease protein
MTVITQGATTTAQSPDERRTKPRYGSVFGSLANSTLYRMTIGALVERRMGRLILLVVVPMIWIVVFNLGPLFQVLRISFLANYPLEEGADAAYTISNYTAFFREPIYYIPFIRSLIFSILATAVTLIVVYPVAYYIAKVVRPQRRTKALLLLLVPFWAGEIIRTFSVIMLLANRGALNMLFRELGLIDRPIPMLYSYFSLSFGVVYLVCLYMLLPLYSAIEKIPSHLLDAAADLGAGPFTRFRRIVLPLSRDGIVSGCCLVFLTCIGVFAVPMLLGGPNTSLFPETIGAFFHGASDKWPTGAAFATMLLIASLVTAGLFMRVVGDRTTRLM